MYKFNITHLNFRNIAFKKQRNAISSFYLTLLRDCLCGWSKYIFLGCFLVLALPVYADQISLTAKQRKHIERSLFPLPQEMKIGDETLSFKPQQVLLNVDPGLNQPAQQYLNDFKQRWEKQFNAALTAGNNTNKKNLTIYIGTDHKSLPFIVADKSGQLSSATNSNQAYSIKCTQTQTGVKVYIAANQASGLYNALMTFEQLLSAMSTPNNIMIPTCQILDWPDIKYRGVWGGMQRGWDKEDNDSLLRYSKMKLNTLWNPFIYAHVTNNGKISYHFNQNIIKLGVRRNVHIVPILVHLDYMFGKYNEIGKNFPELRGKPGKKPFENGAPWCFANPKSQQVLDQIFEAIARDVASDYIWVWPSEYGLACHCSICKGDKRQQNINEFKHIIHAYNKAKVIRSDLHMTLITTQGTRNDNLELLEPLSKVSHTLNEKK